MNSRDSFSCRQTLTVDGDSYDIFSLPAFAKKAGVDLSRLPFSIKVMLENLLRNEDGRFVTQGHILSLVASPPTPLPTGDRAHLNSYSAPSPGSLREGGRRPGEASEIAFTPARVLMQ